MIAYSLLLDKFQTLLKTNSLKFTKQRELVLKFLYENSEHFTPEDIHRLIKQNNPTITIGIATVYRTLSLLEESHIVSSISFGTSGKKYELGVKKHHDHLICSGCETIIEFVDEVIEHRQEEIAKKFDFQMSDHTMKIIGLCKSCQNNINNRRTIDI